MCVWCRWTKQREEKKMTIIGNVFHLAVVVSFCTTYFLIFPFVHPLLQRFFSLKKCWNNHGWWHYLPFVLVFMFMISCCCITMWFCGVAARQLFFFSFDFNWGNIMFWMVRRVRRRDSQNLLNENPCDAISNLTGNC